MYVCLVIDFIFIIDSTFFIVRYGIFEFKIMIDLNKDDWIGYRILNKG